MNPEEKRLLEKAVRLSEENNRILEKMQRAIRWARIWGLIRFLIIVTPIVIGILYLQPFVEAIIRNFNDIRELLPILDSFPQ